MQLTQFETVLTIYGIGLSVAIVVILLYKSSASITIKSNDRKENTRKKPGKRKKTTVKTRQNTKKIMSVLNDQRLMTSGQVAQACNLGKSTVIRYLSRLLKKKKIVRVKIGLRVGYRLPSEGQQVFDVNKSKTRAKK